MKSWTSYAPSFVPCPIATAAIMRAAPRDSDRVNRSLIGLQDDREVLGGGARPVGGGYLAAAEQRSGRERCRERAVAADGEGLGGLQRGAQVVPHGDRRVGDERLPLNRDRARQDHRSPGLGQGGRPRGSRA